MLLFFWNNWVCPLDSKDKPATAPVEKHCDGGDDHWWSVETFNLVMPPGVTFSEQLVVQSLSGKSHSLMFGQGHSHHFAKHLLAIQVAHSCGMSQHKHGNSLKTVFQCDVQVDRHHASVLLIGTKGLFTQMHYEGC